MAKRIRDKRKDLRRIIPKFIIDPELHFMRNKIEKAFPNKEERLNYVRTLAAEFERTENEAIPSTSSDSNARQS